MAKEVKKEISNKSKEFYEFIMPAIDMVENDSDLIILIDLPGFDKNNINLKITKNILSIKATRKEEEYNGTIYFMHRPTKIDKKITLPFSVVDEDITGTAKYDEGIITLKIPIKNDGNIIPIS
ncbi:MAG: archaeal heat shock protein Hsp14 [Nitrososphaeraceae archaeon]